MCHSATSLWGCFKDAVGWKLVSLSFVFDGFLPSHLLDIRGNILIVILGGLIPNAVSTVERRSVKLKVAPLIRYLVSCFNHTQGRQKYIKRHLQKTHHSRIFPCNALKPPTSGLVPLHCFASY